MKFFKQNIDTSENIAQFDAASPFPHVVIDNAIDPSRTWLGTHHKTHGLPSTDEWIASNVQCKI